MKTTVAITSQNKKTVTKHIGKCLNFLIYTIEDNEVTNKDVMELQADEILKNTFHGEQREDASPWLKDINIMLTGSMGPGAKGHLEERNVAAFVIKEKDPDLAIQKLIDGTLEAFVPVAEHHQHAHSHEGGCNHNHGEGGCDHHH